jgi:hypothetical protein
MLEVVGTVGGSTLSYIIPRSPKPKVVEEDRGLRRLYAIIDCRRRYYY